MMAEPASDRLLIAGGGIGGLAAALACARACPSLRITVLEQASAFAEVGAGIQLGPNAVRVLADWGLRPALDRLAVFPRGLRVRAAHDGTTLAHLSLSGRAGQRYGQPYATIHRADLHRLLLDAVRAHSSVQLYTDRRVQTVQRQAEAVAVTDGQGQVYRAAALIGADGVWSTVRAQCLGDGRASYSGHLAYRALIPIDSVPGRLRAHDVVVWLGPRLHAVHYPVRGGQDLNLVVVIEATSPDQVAFGWDHDAHAATLQAALGAVHEDLAALVTAVRAWRMWPLYVREPMRGAHEHGADRVALLGDAAHPTRPYLAQGAAMALEDAWALGRCLSLAGTTPPDWPAVLVHWRQQRWARNARVQSQSRRNGTIFHARGVLRLGRDLALAMLGPLLLDQPWLYSGPPDPGPPPLAARAALSA
jgi:salicylate hydroxylase